ncbi:MAG: GH92 family glycosyl hydrolase [Clostridia bacterium]|nr:GH92 family glycosyl hydrolase [Clostridia bacterium]
MEFLPFVNIKMGTNSTPRFSRGNTLPLTQMPFGMVSLCPQSERKGGMERWFFDPELPSIEGIRVTHQPSPWIGDYGTLVLTPQYENISNTASGAWSSYRIDEARLEPGYIKIDLLRHRAKVELAPTQRCFAIRVEAENEGYLSVLPILGDYLYEINEERGLIYGSTNGHSQDNAKDFRMYFVISLDKIRRGESYIHEGTDGTALHIAIEKGITEGRVGISYISHELAEAAILRECGQDSLEEIKEKARAAWESRLSSIEIEADEKEMKTFYSCMYRAFLFPHMAYEIKEDGTPVHYSPYDGKVYEGVRYTDTGFWDTQRTQFPLFSIIARDDYAQMLEGFACDYKDGGWLPRWPSIGEVGCMPSTLIDGVIADAAVKGIGKKEVLKDAFYGMLKHANEKSPEKRYGREGICEYIKYGYVPKDLYKESVNLTLDFAYGDYCIATVANALGKTKYVKPYLERAKSYKRLFDKKTGFMRGRTTGGEFTKDFDPFLWGGDYTEGSAWQSTLSVPHDIDGLIELYGGREGFISMLDKIFDTAPIFRVGSYGQEIHEMSEMASVDFGQCAISNQPSFSIPFLYAYVGMRERTEEIVSRICRELFSSEDGYPGDEDNGSMSAWYILATIGKYQLCPGKDEYVEFSPRVKIKSILGEEIK